MSDESEKVKRSTKLTKTGIPIFVLETHLPSSYLLDLFEESEVETNTDKMLRDIASVEREEANLKPAYMPNIVPYHMVPTIFDKTTKPLRKDKKKKKDVKFGSSLEQPKTPKKYETVELKRGNSESILENIISFLHNNSMDTPSVINSDITQSIVNEWIRQFMSGQAQCCYNKDMSTLLDGQSKLDIIGKKYPKSNIVLFQLSTKISEKLKRSTRKHNFVFDEDKFYSIIKEDLHKPLFILLVVDNSIYNLLCTTNNYHFQSYFPIYSDKKDYIDKQLNIFLEKKGFSYIADKKRNINEYKDFLPVVDSSIWQEDLCIFVLTETLDNFQTAEEAKAEIEAEDEKEEEARERGKKYKRIYTEEYSIIPFSEIKEYKVTKTQYKHLYTELINFAMDL